MDLDSADGLYADVDNHHIEGFANHGNTPVKCPLITQIDGNLWQGGCIDGVSLGKRFEHVISLYPWEKYTTTNMLASMLEVKLYDSNEMPDRRLIEQIADWINTCVDKGPTLVHCQAGLNRSSLVAAVALMRRHPDWSPDYVINLLRERRSPAVLCNPTFRDWLENYR